ncbi:TIGR04013 family B12-binding domain/radical SAM domain-containing protein [Methanosarcina mazei]|uniref:Radical SAM protein n=5 Tax=Methanosarcina mazei TaxID=2209 RepID=A0A0F8PFY0_METMZ|nr:TIGR04013 family B12-binding domain/radical SAM domain-containing protein [Methanosarcina mazei]AGF96939.1 B12-binding domain/radical SAM domain containing protein [Methanosarcina mazei Tuc01]AKB42060.1 (dimethylallyl)adenosine tRNA methylthiotransferase [Methanosarcina mazei WWM610]AKB66341.1 (dimethylallyl)adenosine tRNA methylthiotransferase [Methanosarcina mazei S-6]AKB73055.1 (dimethylallyl)adenosine tRNA methylthiotransferase [Methanosarcina mazei C16]KKG08293.1 radical SAM protein [M
MEVNFRYSKKNSYSFAVLSPVLPEAGFTDSPVDGIMIYSFTTRQAAKVFKEVENAGKDSIFIAGGPHPSGCPEETLKYFDYVVIGEGEETLPELVRVLQKKGDPGEVRGIAYKNPDTGRITLTPERPHVNLDSYPCFNPKKLRAPIEISRGCPWGCKYCQTPRLFGREVRHRSIDSILKNAQHYNDLRFIASNAFAYGSDGIHPRFDKVEKLLSALHKLPDKKIFFGTFPSEVRPEFVTEESVELVRKYCANDSLSLGAQSGSDRILKEIRRGHTVEDSISAVECCLEHDIMPAVDFIFGLPTETEEDQEKSLELVRWICEKGGTVRAHYMTPLPGTPYASSVPSDVSDRVRRELGKLALGGKLTGYWEKHRKV